MAEDTRDNRKNEDEFAIRCFINGQRKPTHDLTKYQARAFLVAARHLASYLCGEYELPELPAGEDAAYVRKWMDTFAGKEGDVVDGILKMSTEALDWRDERDKLRTALLDVVQMVHQEGGRNSSSMRNLIAALQKECGLE